MPPTKHRWQFHQNLSPFTRARKGFFGAFNTSTIFGRAVIVLLNELLYQE